MWCLVHIQALQPQPGSINWETEALSTGQEAKFTFSMSVGEVKQQQGPGRAEKDSCWHESLPAGWILSCVNFQEDLVFHGT